MRQARQLQDGSCFYQLILPNDYQGVTCMLRKFIPGVATVEKYPEMWSWLHTTVHEYCARVYQFTPMPYVLYSN